MAGICLDSGANRRIISPWCANNSSELRNAMSMADRRPRPCEEPSNPSLARGQSQGQAHIHDSPLHSGISSSHAICRPMDHGEDRFSIGGRDQPQPARVLDHFKPPKHRQYSKAPAVRLSPYPTLCGRDKTPRRSRRTVVTGCAAFIYRETVRMRSWHHVLEWTVRVCCHLFHVGLLLEPHKSREALPSVGDDRIEVDESRAPSLSGQL